MSGKMILLVFPAYGSQERTRQSLFSWHGGKHILQDVFDLFQSDIMDVNQIFKDLAVMIHDQGEMIGE